MKKSAANYLPNIVCYLLLLILLASCSKKQNPIPDPPPSPKVHLTSLSTYEGAYNTTVEVNGYGFSTTIADDRVTFNGVAAKITMATTTQLTVLVPKGAGSGWVQVSANGEQNPDVQKYFTYDLTATVSAFSGNGTAGATNGDAATASFNAPAGLAADSLGNVYVADAGNNLIRKISPADVVTTLAGPEGFNGPNSLAVDAAGNVYVTDAGNNQIKKVTPAGVVSVVAGNGTQGAANGMGTNASFNHPSGIAILVLDGNVVIIIIADSGNNMLRRIAADGTVSNGSDAGAFNYPVGITSYGIVAQQGNNVVNYSGTLIGKPGVQGADNGEYYLATFNHPAGIVSAPYGLVYVADEFNNQVRVIAAVGGGLFGVFDWNVSLWAGTGARGSANGIGTIATFNHPVGITADANGDLYVADSGNNLIRKITIEKL